MVINNHQQFPGRGFIRWKNECIKSFHPDSSSSSTRFSKAIYFSLSIDEPIEWITATNNDECLDGATNKTESRTSYTRPSFEMTCYILWRIKFLCFYRAYNCDWHLLTFAIVWYNVPPYGESCLCVRCLFYGFVVTYSAAYFFRRRGLEDLMQLVCHTWSRNDRHNASPSMNAGI